MKRLDIIDYLKGFSITTIVLAHLLQSSGQIPLLLRKAVSIGGTGVHVFVFCSGFGLYYSALNKPVGFAGFIKTRFSRIYFQYIAAVGVSALVPFAYGFGDRPQALLSHVFLYKMFIPRYDESFGGNFWFMSMIFQFYLAFYLIKHAYARLSQKRFFCACLILSAGWCLFIWLIGKSDERVWNGFFIRYLWEFALGMILAEYYHKNRAIPIPSRGVLLAVSIAGIGTGGAMAMLSDALRTFNDIPIALGYAAFAVLVYSLAIPFVNDAVLRINRFSFSWYLTHNLVFISTARLLSAVPLPARLLITLFFSIAVGILYEAVWNLGKRRPPVRSS